MTAFDLNISYIAGLFDATGNITVKKKKGDKYSLLICVCHMNRGILEWVKAVVDYDGLLQVRHKKGRTVYTLSWSGPFAGGVLRALIPYLRVSKKRASQGIEFQDTMRGWGNKGVPNTVLVRREMLYMKLKR
jgi:hypothetical protein